MRGETRASGKALAATVGMAFLFGTSFVASKVALAGFAPTQLVFVRFAVAGLWFLLLTCRHRPVPLTPAQKRSILLLALLEPGLYFFLESYGLKLTLASSAAVLIATIPLFVMLLETVVLRMPVTALDVSLALLSLLGVGLLLSAGGPAQTFGGTLVGNLLILAAALAASVYTLVARYLMVGLDALTVTRWQAWFAVALYAPFALGEYLRGHTLPQKLEQWLAAIYLGLFCSFAAYFLLNYALSRLRASLVAAFSNLIPVVASGLSVLLLGETLRFQQFLGAALTVGAITVLTLRHREREAAAPPGG